jgi:hypothetical protein
MNRDPFRIDAVAALPGQCLHLTFEDGWQADVALSEWVENTQLFKPLQDATLFAQAKLGDWGTSVMWVDGEIDMGADNLRNRAVEQAGGIGHERLIKWLHDNKLTQTQGAQAIGVSRRMLSYYLRGAKPIPKTVWLACVGWMAQSKTSPMRWMSASGANA